MDHMLYLGVFLLVSLFDVSQCWLNGYDQHLEFSCPEGQYMYKWISEHSNKKEDRVWDFKCRAGFVSNTCQWSPVANNWDGAMDFNCPKDQVLVGAKSDHDNHREDRRWYYKCCKINTKAGTSCYTTGNINDWDRYMSYSVPAGRAITGVKSRHSNKKEDRLWQLKICYFTLCYGNSMKILDVVPSTLTGLEVIGIATSQGCTRGQTYYVNLWFTDNVVETNEVSVTNGDSFTFNTAISVSAEVKAGFLGSSGTVTMGVTQEFGGSVTFSKSTSKSTAESIGSSASNSFSYAGPSAAVIIGEIKRYTINRDSVNVEVNVQCDDGSTFTERTRIKLKSTFYGVTHFSQAIGKYNAGKCTTQSSDCIRSVEGSRALDPQTVINGFKRCFANGVGTVQK